MHTTNVNRALMKLQLRAERNEHLMETFVDVGPLFTLLSSPNHHILYGRRGTGKTHALRYLAERVRSEGDIAILIDLKELGSTGGVYNDPEIPLSERGTRLLSDCLGVVQKGLVESALSRPEESSDEVPQALAVLNSLADEITQTCVIGDVERESVYERADAASKGSKATLSLTPQAPSLGAQMESDARRERSASIRVRESGIERHRVHFGAVGTLLRSVLESLGSPQLWILIDEWSEISLSLQPLLADLIKRCLLPIDRVLIKIAAIEHRSRFLVKNEGNGYMGLELGADVSAALDLDDFMVFGNDDTKAVHFFRELLYKHVRTIMIADRKAAKMPQSPKEFVSRAFMIDSDAAAFREFVRAAEGVPRDAMNIASLCAQLADRNRISTTTVQQAARRWYFRDKEATVVADPRARALLHWIIDKVLNDQRGRAFLFPQEDVFGAELIRALYDYRVLHVLKKGVSVRDRRGLRFDVYGLDYGCYMDLAAERAPQGLFLASPSPGGDGHWVMVPEDDYESIPDAILDLHDFEIDLQQSVARVSTARASDWPTVVERVRPEGLSETS